MYSGDAVDKSRVNVASLHAGRTKTHPWHTRVENVVVRISSSVAGAWTNCEDHSAVLLTDSTQYYQWFHNVFCWVVYSTVKLLHQSMASVIWPLLHCAWVVTEANCTLVTAVCLSVPTTFLHYCTDLDVTLVNGRGCSLVVHCWVVSRFSLLWQHTYTILQARPAMQTSIDWH